MHSVGVPADLTRLTSSQTGPVSPKCANKSEPRRTPNVLSPSRIRNATSGSVTPRSPAIHGGVVVIGARAGRGGTIVWPNFAAMR